MERLIYVFSGDGVKKFFKNEIGIHRWQRTPPTETKGRVHTSTVSVAVLDDKKDVAVTLDYKDITIFYTRGSGNGGQHRNVTDSCVIVRHISGIEVRIDGRNQHKNKAKALKELEKRLLDVENQNYQDKYSSTRNGQVGQGGRANKRRTYNVKTGIVKDHITGKKTSMKNIYKGKIKKLHKDETVK